MNANSFGVFIAFLFSLWMICKLVEAWFNRTRPIVQCDCECDCCEIDEDEDDDDDYDAGDDGYSGRNDHKKGK